MVGGAPGYGFHPSQDTPGSDEMTLPILGSAVPNNGKVGNKVLCPHSLCFGSNLDVIFLMYLVSSGNSFKPTSSSTIILIRPSGGGGGGGGHFVDTITHLTILTFDRGFNS